jgi:hypothetical protein
MHKFVSLALAAITASACMSTSQPTPAVGTPGSIEVAAGEVFDLAVGQEAQIRGTPITVRIVGVSQDSRCPSDVQCVWAGDAVIRLGLSSSTAATSESSIHTNLDPRAAVYSGYQIKVVGLKPAPKSGQPIPAAAYIVSLEVVRL